MSIDLFGRAMGGLVLVIVLGTTASAQSSMKGTAFPSDSVDGFTEDPSQGDDSRATNGGFGPFADSSLVQALTERIRHAFDNEECASLFGGRGPARELLLSTSINYVNRDASNLPVKPRFFPTAIWNAVTDLGTERLPPANSLVFGRAYRVFGVRGLRGIIFLNDNFLEIVEGRATALLHELMHVNGEGPTIDIDHASNYREIATKCGTSPTVVALKSSPTSRQ